MALTRRACDSDSTKMARADHWFSGSTISTDLGRTIEKELAPARKIYFN